MKESSGEDAGEEFVIPSGDLPPQSKGILTGSPPQQVESHVHAMGTGGISRSQVSRLCSEIDDKIATLLNRPDAIIAWMTA